MAVMDFKMFYLEDKIKKVIVVGAGVTGKPAAKLFLNAGFKVYLVDEKVLTEEVREELRGIEIFDNFKPDLTNLKYLAALNCSFIISSPGVSPRGSLGLILAELKIPIYTEFDIAAPYLGMPEVAVTGTNGKTTVVHLIEQMLKESGEDAELVGNVGYSFLSKLKAEDLNNANNPIANKKWVAEFSSYQIEGLRYIKPRVAVILNIDDDHLERHGSLSAYVEAKARLLNWQDKEDIAILNKDEFWCEEVFNKIKGRKFLFGKLVTLSDYHSQKGSYYIKEKNQIIFNAFSNIEYYNLDKTNLIGEHNKLNLAAAIACARFAGANQSAVQGIIDNFKPLAHRVELVKIVSGVSYINDSKGTNVSAVMVALDLVKEDFKNGKVILLLGGKIKEGSWEGIKRKVDEKVRAVIAFGGDRKEVLERLGLELSESTDPLVVKSVESLEYAVYEAKLLARSGDVVLLSPGCASFDAFKDYVDRGNKFKQYVNSL